jgi:hypothetical protein
MKPLLILCLVNFFASAFALADQPRQYPEKEAIMALAFPDDWELEVRNGRLYGHPKEDLSLFVEINELKATPDDGAAVMKEVKDSIAENFKNVNYGGVHKAKYADLGVVVMDATGEDEDGTVSLAAALIVDEKKGKVVMLLRIASPAGLKKHAEAWGKVVASIKAANGK